MADQNTYIFIYPRNTDMIAVEISVKADGLTYLQCILQVRAALFESCTMRYFLGVFIERQFQVITNSRSLDNRYIPSTAQSKGTSERNGLCYIFSPSRTGSGNVIHQVCCKYYSADEMQCQESLQHLLPQVATHSTPGA